MDEDVRSLLREVRLLQLSSQKRAKGLLIGAWHSYFKGNGMEFDEVRPYQAGDEVRSIDWNVTARHGSPYTKIFQEERQLEVHLFCDISHSMKSGGKEESKRHLLAKAIALLGFSAEKNRDRIGGALFTDKIEKAYISTLGKRVLYEMVRDALVFSGRENASSLTKVFEYADRALKKPAILFFLSDFLFPCEPVKLLRLGQRHTLFGIQISDPWDFEVPDMGVVLGADSENGSFGVFDTTSAKERGETEKRNKKMVRDWKSAFIEASGRYTVLQVESSIWNPIKTLFTKRVR